MSRRSGCAFALIAVALTFGGGGSPAPIAELVVQIAALIAVVAALFLSDSRPSAPCDWPVLIGSLALVGVIAIQLIPLPPAIWHDLPGRDVEQQALALIGAEDSWRPISIAPQRTLAALLSLIPPVATLWLVARLDLVERSRVLLLVAAIGVLSVLVGAIQMSSGSANLLRFYGTQLDGYLTGFQANRNATVDVLLIALAALGAWLFARPHRSAGVLTAAAAAGGLIALGAVLTGSRAGMGLLAAMVGIVAAALLWRVVREPRLRLAALAVIIIALIGAWLLRDNPVVQNSIIRFGSEQDQRPGLWADTLYAIGHYLPWGSGMGTFVPVLIAAEQLNVVDDTWPNRAHNDYLEFALEAGIPAVMLMVGAIGGLIWRVIARLREPADRMRRHQHLFAIAALMIVALHSIVDYPLRSLSLACLAALGVAMLTKPARGSAGDSRET